MLELEFLRNFKVIAKKTQFTNEMPMALMEALDTLMPNDAHNICNDRVLIVSGSNPK